VGKPNRIVWCMAAVWVAVVACSKQDDKKPLELATGGALTPEIGWRESPEPIERAPISLTASDGSGLRLVALRARTVIEDPLAFTELHLTFHNPEPRRREGRFEITLPQNAAISRFAMKVGSELQEGEVVERQRAQQVYEDFLHRKQDPALLEKDAGNEFAARVFPIEPNANKEIILSYSEELPRSDVPYVMLLKGLPQLADLDIEVQVGSSTATGHESTERARSSIGRLKLYEQDFAPRADLEVRLPWQKSVALRNGDLVLARVAPILELPAEPITGLTVLLDSSASRALGFAAQIERLGALLAELHERAGEFDLRVVAFDQSSEDIYSGPASGFGLREQSKLLGRDALGATDLGQALAFVAAGASPHPRVLLIGDGVITAGQDDTTGLREAVAKLAAHGVRRLDVLAEGGIQDRESLSSLTRSGLASAGVVLDARSAVPQLVDRLLLGTRDRIDVHVTGASFVYPSVLEGVQPGDERLVFAQLPEATPLQIELEGAGAAAFETLEVPRPLLERALARARIEALTGELRALRPDAATERTRKQQEIVALSLQHRVVSDHTALLVLETAADYQRFGIAQNALTSILRVGDEGIELFDRRALPRPSRDDRRALEIATDEELMQELAARRDREPPTEGSTSAPGDDAPGARGFGGLGLQGTGRGGGGGASRPAPGPVAEAPMAEKKEAPRAKAMPAGAAWAAAEAEMAPARPASSAPAPASPPAPMRARASRDKAANAGPASLGGLAGDDLLMDASEADSLRRRPERPQERPQEPQPELQIVAPEQLQARATVRLRGQPFRLDSAAAAAALRPLKPRAEQCYERASTHAAGDRLVLELAVSDKGSVLDVFVSSGSVADPGVKACIVAAARVLRLPKPEGGNGSAEASVELSMQPVAAPPQGTLAGTPRPRPRPRAQIPEPAIEDAYEGVLAEVLAAIARGDKAGALARATAARAQDPGDVIGLIALGEALEAQQDFERAARAYGSLIDLFPSRADLRRMASARLERLPSAGLGLAVDSYRHAVEQRPDHPSGHRGLAYAQWKHGEHAAAFETLEHALDRGYRADRFEGVDRILREDLALIGAAWVRAEPGVEAKVRGALAARGLTLDRAPSLRFVLSWETDANDVDFHLYDGHGGHAYYMKPKLPMGGSLYADITTGYGPECFAVPGRARHYPYVLQAHYFARGPMGYGMGKLQVVEHDGEGGLEVEDHPFVIMKDKAFVELARLSAP
jgi:tetratricopeptide (TPR) repeat protein